MQPYQHLFQPLRLGRTVLKNRIEAAPVSVANLSPQAHFTPENIAVFERKAKGGAAVINMGEARIDLKTGISHWLCLALDDPEVLPSLLWATDAIKRHDAIPAVELLHPGGRANPAYYDGPIWAPSDAPGHLGKDYTALDEETILASAAKTGRVVTVEEHSVYGGMGSAVAELLGEKHPVPVTRIGMTTFGTSGEPDELLAHFGLDASGIARRVREVLGR